MRARSRYAQGNVLILPANGEPFMMTGGAAYIHGEVVK